MDETLLDFKRAERVNLTQVLLKFGIKADETLLSRFHEINDTLWKQLERGETTRVHLKVQRFELLFKEFGASADPAAAAQAYWENFPSVSFPFEGALDFLIELKTRGRVYIVTNGGARIQNKHIEDSGFLPYLDGVFISEEIGFDKPSLAFADYVEAHIGGYERGRAVWVGDSLTSDGACAKNRGIEFILFAPHGTPEDYRGISARNYREVLKILDMI